MNAEETHCVSYQLQKRPQISPIEKLGLRCGGGIPIPALPHQMGKGDSFPHTIVNTTLFPSPFDGEGGRPKAGRVRIRASKSPSPSIPPTPWKESSPLFWRGAGGEVLVIARIEATLSGMPE